jgi:hypothetical protein
MSRETHRVAVVVFAECEGADYHDAAMGAQMSLNQFFREHAEGDYKSWTIPSPPRKDGYKWDTTIHDVVEVGIAAGNGYLWTRPTRKAFPRPDDED